MASSSPDTRPRNRRDTPSRLSLTRVALLLLLALGLPRIALAEPDSAVFVSASVYATFSASPTLHLSRPDIGDGGNNSLFATGSLEQVSVFESFREIYQGVGESGTSLFEVDMDGSAHLGSKNLGLDILVFDQNNASASHWSVTGRAGHYQWLRLSGPTDASGNYVISFTTQLGSVSAENRQPLGFTAIWKANISTQLYAEPHHLDFPVLSLSAFVEFKEACPTLADPPCQFIPRLLVNSGEVTVPGSDPVLRVSHQLTVLGKSTRAQVPAASMDMTLPPGVSFTIFQPVPEPAGTALGLAALLTLAGLRRRRGWSFLARRGHTASSTSSNRTIARVSNPQ